jgi:hypothetical protein
MLTRPRRRRAVSAALGATLAAAATFAACYPDVTDSRSADTVATFRSPQAAFGTPVTYVVPDSVIHVVPEGGEDDIPRTVDAQILSAIRDNMNRRGYVEETDPANNPPDLALVASATTQTNIVYYYYSFWSYWGWYPYWPGYGGGYGWYYPGYVPVPYVYNTGTVLISMIDLKASDIAQQRVDVIWLAALNGLLNGTPTGARVGSGVDRAFEQSPYITR